MPLSSLGPIDCCNIAFTGIEESRPDCFITGDRGFEQAVFAEPAEAICVVFSISPDAQNQYLPLDLHGLHKDVAVFAQFGTKVYWDKVGQQGLIDYDGVTGTVGSKDQCAGSAFAQIFRHD